MPQFCSRCNKDISELVVHNSEGMTMGYYGAADWSAFSNPGEIYICDACMFQDPRYITVYGRHT